MNGAARLHVAAINATRNTLRPWKANTNGKVDVIVTNRTRVYIGGTFTTLKGKTRNRLGAVSIGASAALINWTPTPAPRSTRCSSRRRASGSTSAAPSTT